MPDLASVLEQARVPEHSAPFMQAMSQGTAFLEGEYLFLTADDWLMAIGYPLSGEYAHDSFERALAAALRRVPKRLEGVDCWAIGPDLPARLAGHVTDRDTFYILPCDAPVPARLRRPVEIAAEKLTVREGRDFTLSVAEMFSIAKALAASQTNMIPFVAAGLFYYIFNLVVAVGMEWVEKKMDYYR